MNGKQEHNPRGDVIMEAAEAGLSAVLDVLETHGKTTLAEVSCISTLLRDMLMERTEKSLRLQSNRQPTEIDMLFAMFGDKLMS